MSVICFDGTTLAADKRMCHGTFFSTTTKIYRVGDDLVGFSGDAAQGQAMVAWFRDGAKPEEFPASQTADDDWSPLMVVKRGGIVLRYEKTPYPFPIEDKFVAMGSGRDFAIAAMECGKSAVEAVLLASKFCNGCGNGVDSMRFDQDLSADRIARFKAEILEGAGIL